MELKPFCFPNPETRLFIMSGDVICKIRLQYGLTSRDQWTKLKDDLCIHQELELAIRVTLGNEDELKPFVTDSLSIFPYKHVWEGAGSMRFREHGRDLRSHPFIFILYIEVLNKGRQSRRVDGNGRGADHSSSIDSESDSLEGEEEEEQLEFKRRKRDQNNGEGDDNVNRSSSTETDSSQKSALRGRKRNHDTARAELPPALSGQCQATGAVSAGGSCGAGIQRTEASAEPANNGAAIVPPQQRSWSQAVFGLLKLPLKLFGF